MPEPPQLTSVTKEESYSGHEGNPSQCCPHLLSAMAHLTKRLSIADSSTCRWGLPFIMRNYVPDFRWSKKSRDSAQHVSIVLRKPRLGAVSWNSNYGSHGWHRYIGRFPSHVIRALLNYFGADSKSVVCDPFAGSGTTAVECRLLGIPFVGIEICPLSAMMTRTKSAFPNDPRLLFRLSEEFTGFYDAKWKAFVETCDIGGISHQTILEREGNSIHPFANVERWFSREALLGTSIAVEFGMTLEGFAREAVLVALSAKMRSIGNVDVDVVRAEYRKTPRTNVDVGKLVSRQLHKMARDISVSLESHSELAGPESAITVYEGSMLDIDLGEESVSHIITSPPYGIEAVSYLRTHLLSYRSLVAHLDHDPYETRDKTIGSEYLENVADDVGILSQAHSLTCRAFFENNQQNDNGKYHQRRAAMMQFLRRYACRWKQDGTLAKTRRANRLRDRQQALRDRSHSDGDPSLLSYSPRVASSWWMPYVTNSRPTIATRRFPGRKRSSKRSPFSCLGRIGYEAVRRICPYLYASLSQTGRMATCRRGISRWIRPRALSPQCGRPYRCPR